jgi:hypothetical protein
VDHGFQYYSAFATLRRGQALAELNRLEEGLAQIRDGLAVMRVSGGADFSITHAVLAEALLKAGRGSEGVVVVDERLAASARTSEGEATAELYRIRGDLLLLQAQPGCDHEAENSFRQAIDIARHQQGKWWELRATVSLARLLASQGHRHEASTMLGDIYNWFTEGFDTRELQEAKQLLHELAQES